MSLDPTTIASLLALATGFAAAGLTASAFELVTHRRASFALLRSGGLAAIASVPLIAVTAPFIILRNTVRGRRFERRPVPFVVAASTIAGFWSLASGHLILDIARLIGS